MKATVQKPFKGVPDGQVHPRDFVFGEIVEGDLALVAIQEDWALSELAGTALVVEENSDAGDLAGNNDLEIDPAAEPSDALANEENSDVNGQVANGKNTLPIQKQVKKSKK
ncbi:MAG: hypothetical protein IPI58_09880 [Alphaproteobacteria bacterium]|nr:MAG: hypothetical protein IPI58_09880 [Alphaproteobacteria bacterium]